MTDVDGAGASGLALIAQALHESEDLEGTVRPILRLLADACNLDTTYLTTWDRANGLQEWRFVYTARGPELPEGGTWPWDEVLCDRCLLQGQHVIADVGEELPDHPSHTLLGVRGFVSMPYTLVGRGAEIAGTLCGSSLEPLTEVEPILHLFDLCAHLVADRLGREIELGRVRIRAEAAERRLRAQLNALDGVRAAVQEAATRGRPASLEAVVASLDQVRDALIAGHPPLLDG